MPSFAELLQATENTAERFSKAVVAGSNLYADTRAAVQRANAAPVEVSPETTREEKPNTPVADPAPIRRQLSRNDMLLIAGGVVVVIVVLVAASKAAPKGRRK